MMELFVVVGMVLILYYLFKKSASKRLTYINRYKFHPTLAKKVKQRYPHLSDKEVAMVFKGLRDYFLFCHQANKKMVAMPSQAVDVAWHEFILFTREYETFSKKAIGRFLHHTPTEAMKSPMVAQEGIQRAWRLACAHEKIDKDRPEKLPLLFAIDGLLKIEDGFSYTLDCKDKNSPSYGAGYCAGDIGCTSGCGGDSGGFFDSNDSGGSDCGGGCGGD